MRVDSNRWNRWRYTFWAPVYDLAVRGLDRRRRDSLALLAARPGERLLIVGAGTGADLKHLPDGCAILATDLTPAMLRRARPRARPGTHLVVMDGHQLAVPDAAFDGVVLHLILAVIPEPARCLREPARVLRPGGRVVVFDKFVRGPGPGLALRVLNAVVRVALTYVDEIILAYDIRVRSENPWSRRSSCCSDGGRIHSSRTTWPRSNPRWWTG